MIGNSVSPIIARAIFAALRSKFEEGQALATAAE
jgi:hypothetical protein